MNESDWNRVFESLDGVRWTISKLENEDLLYNTSADILRGLVGQLEERLYSVKDLEVLYEEEEEEAM